MRDEPSKTLDPQTYAAFAAHTRRATVRLLTKCPDDALTWQTPGLKNHVLWRCGHAVATTDWLCLHAITGVSAIDNDWERWFAGGSDPSAVTDWPDRQAVLDALEAQVPAIEATVAKASPEQWAAPVDGITFAPTLADVALHAVFDEAMHIGESRYQLKLYHQATQA